MSWLQDLREAAESAKAAWTGCNWATQFGVRQLDLTGVRSRQAAMVAKATRGGESLCWREAAAWLATIEADAAEAAKRADLAIQAAEAGDVAKASQGFEEAASIASQYPCGDGYHRCRHFFEQRVLQKH